MIAIWHIRFISLLAGAPRRARGRKGLNLNKKSIHEMGAPYITPSFHDFHHSSHRSTYLGLNGGIERGDDEK